MNEDSCFTTVDVSQFQPEVAELFRRTAQRKGRVEVKNCSGDSCLIISKTELEAMERALAILANGNLGKMLRRSVRKVADLAQASSGRA